MHFVLEPKSRIKHHGELSAYLTAPSRGKHAFPDLRVTQVVSVECAIWRAQKQNGLGLILMHRTHLFEFSKVQHSVFILIELLERGLEVPWEERLSHKGAPTNVGQQISREDVRGWMRV